jgi:hypothetical protein
MSRTLSLISPAGQYASPNQLVTAQIATNVGFNANDYVYAYGNNQVGSLGATIPVGTALTFVAGKKITGGVQSFAPTSVMAGPYSASATYTGATRTRGNVFQGPSNISANNVSLAKHCVLNNGNIAVVFRDTTDNNYTKWAVFTNSGTTIKAPEILSFQGQVGQDENTISISGMADGGFVIGFTTDNSSNRFSRFTSNGTRTIDQQILVNNLATYRTNFHVAGLSNGGFAFVGNNSAQQTFVASYSSSNAYIGELSISGATSTYVNGIVGLSNGNIAVVMNHNSSSFYYTILTPSLSVVFPWTSVNNLSNNPFSLAAFDTGFIVGHRNPNNGYCRLISITNNGSVISSGVEAYQSNSTFIGVAIGDNNTAYLLQASGSWFVTKYVDINLPSMKVETTFTVNGYTPGNYQADNFYSALNGSYSNVGMFSNIAKITTIDVETYTQNTTVLTNQGLYTPPNGYYFLGVAATTAAANSSGLVYTNGGIALPSTYPSVTTGYAFDYQSNGYWSQRGTINGRAINLQGAQ